MSELVEHLIREAISKALFPQHLKLYPKTSYQRRVIHLLCEDLGILSYTDKQNPFMYFHYQGEQP
jgi:hypothetical protein